MLSTAMYRRIEHIEAELLICCSPASICNYIFSAVFTYFLGVFYAKTVGFWGGAPDPGGGAYSAPPHPLAGREGCPPPAPSPGRPRLLLRPTLTGAPPSPPPPPPPSQFLDPPLIANQFRFCGAKLLCNFLKVNYSLIIIKVCGTPTLSFMIWGSARLTTGGR